MTGVTHGVNTAPSARVRELIRLGAEQALAVTDEWIRAVDAATLSSGLVREVADDPDLSDAVRRGNLDNLLAWATANLRAPGEPVPANTSDVQIEVARAMTRRGMSGVGLDTYRTGQNVAWQRWMALAFDLTRDPDELRELLEVTSASIASFIDRTVEAVSLRMVAEHDDLTRGSRVEQRETVGLLLQGAPVPRARAEAVLRYALDRSHLAVVLWSDDAGAAPLDRLDRAAERTMAVLGARERLVVDAAPGTLWVWFPVPRLDPAAPAALEAELEDLGASVALGRPGSGVDGLRTSHLEAAEARRLGLRARHRAGRPLRVVAYDDVRLAALVAREPAAAAAFVADVLGGLATAPEDLRETVRVVLACLGNVSAAAARLYTHRNTVMRRLERADTLLPRPLAEDPVQVAVALEALRWGALDP